MSTLSHFKSGDHVVFTCHMLGEVSGTIQALMRCLTNGQPHAIVRVTLAENLPIDCCEPLINLRLL